MDDLAKEIAGHVKSTGWFVIGVEEDETGPGFAYSIGLEHSYKHPEVILKGLAVDIMMSLVNDIGNKVKSGQIFKAGERSSDVFGGSDCLFVEVPASAYEDHPVQAKNYYKGKPFRALQCLWPDKQARFPVDPACDKGMAARQSLAASIHNHRFADGAWPFADADNTAAFTTTRVMKEGYPILLVTHDSDDSSWQFLCGTTNESKHLMIVALAELFESDRTIGHVADLPTGWQATRESVSARWVRKKNSP